VSVLATLVAAAQPVPVPAPAPAAQTISQPPISYPAIMPILIILGAACVAVLFEAFLPRYNRLGAQLVLSVLAIVVAGWRLISYANEIPETGTITLGRALAVDKPTLVLWATLLVLTIGALILMADRTVERGGYFVADAAVRPGTVQDRAQAGRGEMQTEVFPLALFALGGMMVFVAANDLLTMFIALEVLSLPLYLMCGLARRRRLLSQEAAVKYFLLGAFASAF